MLHEIDLGEELVINVKWKGATYALREPTVKEIDGFRGQDATEGTKVLTGFLGKLGMPEGVVEEMGMSKAKQLVDGLMDILNKKK